MKKRLSMPFRDVYGRDYFCGAVLWAADRGITAGVSAAAFRPYGLCTRAQAAVMLWRTAGSPLPERRSSPFRDVKPDAYYSDAVLWAVEQGVAAGVSDSAFRPNAPVSRAQALVLLWRWAGAPLTGGGSFADVPDGAFCADAIRWAAARGITLGISPTAFHPHWGCTRAQMVTFLHRAASEVAN